MSKSLSIYERAMRAFAWYMRAEMASDRINDFGESTAIREDMKHLDRDAEAFLDSIERRSWDLVNRCDKVHNSTGGSAK